jgi:NAD-dependent deacetylase
MQEARQWLAEASSVAVLTGAGISAESGVPTFRGPGGLWKTYRPEELATPEAFARDPKLVWEWYLWRRELISKTEPNAGHLALVELEDRAPEFTLVTQNVDGLHDRAGSRNVLKVHGDLWDLRCLSCHRESRDDRLVFPDMPPRCSCGGTLRPGVVWFGEGLPQGVWEAAERAVASCDVMLVVGTSAVVYPAAGLVPYARGRGARVIEVNLEETPYSTSVDKSFLGKAGEILPELVAI